MGDADMLGQVAHLPVEPAFGKKADRPGRDLALTLERRQTLARCGGFEAEGGELGHQARLRVSPGYFLFTN